MANVSSADGQLTITAQSEQTVRAIFEGIIRIPEQDKWDYGIYTGYDTANPPRPIKIERKQDVGYVSSFDFWGDGRWAMRHTLESYTSEVAKTLKDKNPELLARLEKEEFKIDFNYVDFEFGAQFITDDAVTISHTANTPLENSKFFVTGSDREWTFENIQEASGLDDRELIDILGGIDEAKEIGYEPTSTQSGREALPSFTKAVYEGLEKQQNKAFSKKKNRQGR